MKIATANRIDEFWKESKGVLLPKSNVLNTLEEIEANTNEENIAGATALKEVNNNLMSGLGGNKLIYNESEDAYYIQHGADSVRKKLGSGLKLKVLMHYAGGQGYSPNGGYASIYENESASQIKLNSGSFERYTGGIYGSNSDTVLTQTGGLNIPVDNWTKLTSSDGIYDISGYRYIMLLIEFSSAQYTAGGPYSGKRWIFTQD